MIEKFDLLIPTRNFERIQLYKVNSDSPVLRKYLALVLERGFTAAGTGSAPLVTKAKSAGAVTQ